MLTSLKIENYALIEQLDIDFEKGLTIITGETGAGKSILLGALGLILGQRADTSVLKNNQKNCFVEGTFDVSGYALHDLFEANDVDEDTVLHIRRIINPAGKSRAYINEAPVSLGVLREFTEKLIDIHSQHQNLLISNVEYQLSIVDAMADHKALLADYAEVYKEYKRLTFELAEFEERVQQAQNDQEYLRFQLEQLEAVKPVKGEQDELEAESKQLSNAEEIKQAFLKVSSILSGDELSALQLLREVAATLGRVVPYVSLADELSTRIDSVIIELKDIASEAEAKGEDVSLDPQRLEYVQQRLDALYALQQKHRVSSFDELIPIYEDIKQQLDRIDNFDIRREELKRALNEQLSRLTKLAQQITKNRKATIGAIEKYIVTLLASMGIAKANLKVLVEETVAFLPTGKDKVSFLFSANSNMPPQDIAKAASGGEISRLMLAIKSLIVKNTTLPTIIFDEIDSGVSGEVADKIGSVIVELAQNTQVINITHLPQVAAKGQTHYFVYKHEVNNNTVTEIKKLNENERIHEIAKMLSGQRITEASLQNAKELLGGI